MLPCKSLRALLVDIVLDIIVGSNDKGFCGFLAMELHICMGSSNSAPASALCSAFPHIMLPHETPTAPACYATFVLVALGILMYPTIVIISVYVYFGLSPHCFDIKCSNLFPLRVFQNKTKNIKKMVCCIKRSKNWPLRAIQKKILTFV